MARPGHPDNPKTGPKERKVIEVVPGSPAELGGVQRGWIVVARRDLTLPT